MRNPWVGQNSGVHRIGLSAISPYLFAQKKLLNLYFLPKLRDLPQNDVLLYMLRFSFGDTPGTLGLATLETQNNVQQIELPTFVWAISGQSTTPAGGGSNGFLFELYHTHGSNRRRWFQKHVSDVEVLGSGTRPHLFRNPYMLLPEDSIECEVKNTSTPVAPAVTSIGVTLYCGQIVGVR